MNFEISKIILKYLKMIFILKPVNEIIFCYLSIGKYRYLWENYYKKVDGVIFVVDSSDRLRIAVARDELQLFLDHREMSRRKV